MNYSTRFSFLIVVLFNVTASVLCCSLGSCPESAAKSQHEHQPQAQVSKKPQQIHAAGGDTPTTSTAIPQVKSVLDVVRGRPGTIIQSIELKEMVDKNENAWGEKRNKRHVHLDLGYGIGHHHHLPVFGFQDYHFDHGYGHYGHHHHHHHGHHHHH